MLTVCSSQGSPGATTLAVYCAAHWASQGREVLLIEADGSAGSIAHKLGLQVAPGTASFLGSELPATAINLIEHAQDVLFSGLHIMPAPTVAAGAAAAERRFSAVGEDLRDVSGSEMAVVVDAGRLGGHMGDSGLIEAAAGVLVVSQGEENLAGLEYLGDKLVADPSQPGPLGLAVTIGPSALSANDWEERFGLTHVGAITARFDVVPDLSMMVSRPSRKQRKLRSEIDLIASSLYDYAYPGGAEMPRARRPRPAAPSQQPAEASDAAPTERSLDESPHLPEESGTAPQPDDQHLAGSVPLEARELQATHPDWEETGRTAEIPLPPPEPDVSLSQLYASDPIQHVPAHREASEYPHQPQSSHSPYETMPPEYPHQPQPSHSPYETMPPEYPHQPQPSHSPYETMPPEYPYSPPHQPLYVPHDPHDQPPTDLGTGQHGLQPIPDPEAAATPAAGESPAPPTGSFRAWATALHGESANPPKDRDAAG
ncbi:hypothetical protein [Candidatus Poriferisodalis sp.]|uniref:hypothetical protein n=1 Tax=Candidatus Poriferisodalis sp. TaxID=3101277 RepID=UPI003B0117C7